MKWKERGDNLTNLGNVLLGDSLVMSYLLLVWLPSSCCPFSPLGVPSSSGRFVMSDVVLLWSGGELYNYTESKINKNRRTKLQQ